MSISVHVDEEAGGLLQPGPGAAAGRHRLHEAFGMTPARRLTAEGLGTAFLLAAVVGSGIMGDRLAGGNEALALLANTLATGAALVALIVTFGPISGGHFNPVVTLAVAYRGGCPWRTVPGYVLVQIAGALVGVASAHLMFGEPAFALSHHARSGMPQLWSEFVATFGLLTVILLSRPGSEALPFAIGAYIAAAYWFTASTSFANPAVTLARAATDTFSGIRPADAPGFIGAQLLAGAIATAVCSWLSPISKPSLEDASGRSRSAQAVGKVMERR